MFLTNYVGTTSNSKVVLGKKYLYLKKSPYLLISSNPHKHTTRTHPQHTCVPTRLENNIFLLLLCIF